MKIKEDNGKLIIETQVYQARHGALYLLFGGDDAMLIPKQFADKIAYEVPDFDVDLYDKFYA